MTSEFWIVFFVLVILSVLGCWLLLMAQPSTAHREKPTLNTRNDEDERC